MPINRRRTIDDDDDFDERGILKDGRRIRVPLTMMDSANQQVIAERYPPRSARSTSRPTLDALADPRSPEHAAFMTRRAMAADAYRAMCDELSSAWRRPLGDTRRFSNSDPTGEETFGSTPNWRGDRPGDACMINGAPGHLDENLRCIPDRQDGAMDARDAMLRKHTVPIVDAATSNRIREEAYREMCDELKNAWRK